MKHERLLINVTEWLGSETKSTPADAIVELNRYLITQGYRSLESELAGLLGSFLGHKVDQGIISSEQRQSTQRRFRSQVFGTCYQKNEALFFVDMHSEPMRMYVGPQDRERIRPRLEMHHSVEVDIFCVNDEFFIASKESIAQDVVACFHLKSPPEEFLKATESIWPFALLLGKRLVTSAPPDTWTINALRLPETRAVLRELKRRTSILGRDLADLTGQNLQLEQVENILETLSLGNISLIEKKYAIVCKETQEIIFLMRTAEDIDAAKHLECPKCSRLISVETVMPYYTISDGAKEILDGNRWMPSLAREALINEGVSAGDIYTEVKHGEDEIDLLSFYRRRILIMEVKDRPVHLNDAYKLSAKVARIESVLSRVRESDFDDLIRDGDKQLAMTVFDRDVLRGSRLTIGRRAFIPVVITTQDIAKDARDLLLETKETAQFLENAEGKIDQFVKALVRQIDYEELDRRFSELTSMETDDSVSNLGAAQVQLALLLWRRGVK